MLICVHKLHVSCKSSCQQGSKHVEAELHASSKDNHLHVGKGMRINEMTASKGGQSMTNTIHEDGDEQVRGGANA